MTTQKKSKPNSKVYDKNKRSMPASKLYNFKKKRATLSYTLEQHVSTTLKKTAVNTNWSNLIIVLKMIFYKLEMRIFEA